MSASIVLRGVTVRAPDGTVIVQGLDLKIEPGESVAILGRSGAGKTTTLRLINGMARPTEGEVEVDGRPLASAELIAMRRRMGYMIQGVGLFPHRRVYDNVAIVPRLLEWPEERTRPAAERLLDSLGIPFHQYAPRFPRTLSGGEQQRVGIARAMIADPAILLCDEPFGALDPIVRREQQDAFVALRARGAATIVFVTHDLREALRVTDRILLMDRGRIVLDCKRQDFSASKNPLARQFVESATLGTSS
jgi:osmoprotectant transport system ATP-binding protein